MPEIGTANSATHRAHGIFAGAAAGSGLFFYLLSQSLQPALQTAGLDGMWLDVCLLAGGLAGLWWALSPRAR